MSEGDIENYKQTFDLYDDDQDGKLEKDELKDALDLFKIVLTDEDLMKFKEYEDEDGKYTFDSFMKIVKSKQEAAEPEEEEVAEPEPEKISEEEIEKYKQTFDLYDDDEDGKLDHDELKDAVDLFQIKMSGEELELVKKDHGGEDGKYTFDSFVKIVRSKLVVEEKKKEEVIQVLEEEEDEVIEDGISEESLQTSFDMSDDYDGGYVLREDLDNAITMFVSEQVTKEEVDEYVEKYDEKKEGKFTYEMFSTIIRVAKVEFIRKERRRKKASGEPELSVKGVKEAAVSSQPGGIVPLNAEPVDLEDVEGKRLDQEGRGIFMDASDTISAYYTSRCVSFVVKNVILCVLLLVCPICCLFLPCLLCWAYKPCFELALGIGAPKTEDSEKKSLIENDRYV